MVPVNKKWTLYKICVSFSFYRFDYNPSKRYMIFFKPLMRYRLVNAGVEEPEDYDRFITWVKEVDAVVPWFS
jgi:hypothetical protein